MLNLKINVDCRCRCKHCGKMFKEGREFNNHLAYEHEIYLSRRYKIKDRFKKIINKLSRYKNERN